MKKMESLKGIEISDLITHNFWLKVVSLIIAIIIWLYISGEITKSSPIQTTLNQGITRIS